MKPKTPQSITNSHKSLLAELKAILDNYPNIKETIEPLSEIMSDHFRKEEEYALSPLGLLIELSEDKWQLNEDVAMEMSKSVNLKLSELKEDHKNIAKMLPNLKLIEQKINSTNLKKFINDLEIHMELEDQVLYPATVLIVNSILIGDFFKKNKNPGT